jgi:ribosomal protein S12 methylthiotransferase accessory factor
MTSGRVANTRVATPSPRVKFRGTSYQLPKRFDIGNSDRTMSPEDTFQNVRPAFSRVGLTRVGNITGLDRLGIPVTVAIRPNSYSLTQSSGKGTTLPAALTSAAMESLELYCAENVTQAVLHASYDEICHEYVALAVEDMYLSKYSLFHPKRAEEWLLGWDIMNDVEVAVPYHSVSVDFRVLNDASCPASFTMDSNGLASGNHFLEALISALHEVIERDGVSIHSELERHGQPKRRVDLDAFGSDTVLALARRLEEVGVLVAVLDCTTDIGIPIFEAFVYDVRSNTIALAHGYGAHLNPATAATRAITEAVQARTLIVSGARDDLFKDIYTAHRFRYRSNVGLLETNHIRVPMNHVDQSTSSFEDDVGVLLNALRGAGLNRVIVLDLSPDDVDISVLRVLVPGLEGYHYYGYNPRARARRYVSGLARQVADPREDPTHMPAGGIA